MSLTSLRSTKLQAFQAFDARTGGLQVAHWFGFDPSVNWIDDRIQRAIQSTQSQCPLWTLTLCICRRSGRTCTFAWSLLTRRRVQRKGYTVDVYCETRLRPYLLRWQTYRDGFYLDSGTSSLLANLVRHLLPIEIVVGLLLVTGQYSLALRRIRPKIGFFWSRGPFLSEHLPAQGSLKFHFFLPLFETRDMQGP